MTGQDPTQQLLETLRKNLVCSLPINQLLSNSKLIDECIILPMLSSEDKNELIDFQAEYKDELNDRKSITLD